MTFTKKVYVLFCIPTGQVCGPVQQYSVLPVSPCVSLWLERLPLAEDVLGLQCVAMPVLCDVPITVRLLIPPPWIYPLQL